MHRSVQSLAVFLLAFAGAAAAASDTAVAPLGHVIAEQGNRALQQIRDEQAQLLRAQVRAQLGQPPQPPARPA